MFLIVLTKYNGLVVEFCILLKIIPMGIRLFHAGSFTADHILYHYLQKSFRLLNVPMYVPYFLQKLYQSGILTGLKYSCLNRSTPHCQFLMFLMLRIRTHSCLELG